MLDFSGRKPIWTTAYTGALGETTIYWEMEVVDYASATTQALITFGGRTSLNTPMIYQGSSKLYFTIGWFDLFGNRPGTWTVPIPSDGRYQCAMKFNFANAMATDPTFYINGVKQTVTETDAPEGSDPHVNDIMCVGGAMYVSYTSSPYFMEFYPWRSKIGEIAICNALHQDYTMLKFTSSRIKGFVRQTPNLTHYFPMDEVPDGGNICTLQYLPPNSDITSLWTNKTQATYWQSINVWPPDVDYIQAIDADDNEEQQFAMDSYTLPAGVTCNGCNVIFYGKTADTANLTVKLKVGGTWINIGSTTSDGTWRTPFNSTPNYQSFAYYNPLTQADIDDLQVGLLTPAMGKNDIITIYFMDIQLMTSAKSCFDKKGGWQLAGSNALGKAENYSSYIGSA